MKVKRFIWGLACISALPMVAAAGAFPATISACKPAWAVGDWWTVDSQRFDRGENLPGATPHWLDRETWRFSVDATNSIDGQPCYEVSVTPGTNNLCPYWFVYSFRMSDLLVLQRELHQPMLEKTGRGTSAPVIISSYSKDDQTPLVPSDFPNLPMTVPHFAGGQTNSYRSTGPRTFSGSLTQTFQQDGKATGVIVITPSAERYYRQNWDGQHPWHTYAEKWEFGDLVHKSWLTDSGHLNGP